jgi:putative transposase
MSRKPRIVFPDVPHHVTQRGNYRQDVFSCNADRSQYLLWLREYAEKYGLEIWAYCLMSTHVHLIAVPRREDSLARTLGATHMRYAQYIHRTLKQSGHLWQGRFFSCALDEVHLITAARYVERNPVRARLVERATDWPWSSARAHANGEADAVVEGASWPTQEIRATWSDILAEPDKAAEVDAIRRQTYTGRPLGTDSFIARLETMAGRILRALPRGRPKKEK